MNRLADETSPYLLQHADNPVDWYPWGKEALLAARAEGKPILLSIGYSACHWCHVMAHESFEDKATGALMNELFINIKVDREERPDIDKIYQTAHQLLTQRAGGWPLTMFLNPEDQRPFFGGTYFPKTPRYGMPSFSDLLQRVAAFYAEHLDDVRAQGRELVEIFARLEPESDGAALVGGLLPKARERIARDVDREFGGFGGAPKFPHPTSLDRLLRYWGRTAHELQPDADALSVVSLTLTRMAEGGIYDQLGGGFCRYSVDRNWQIPHFEKMLYDNGPLLALYSQLFLATGDALFARVADETADWMLEDMRAPNGGFYSSRDADSEGEEGLYYVWTPEQVRGLLPDDQYEAFTRRFGLTDGPNFEGQWHLTVRATIEDVAEATGQRESEVGSRVEAARRTLLSARAGRVPPGRDEKQLTSWNALAIRGLSIAGKVLERDDLIQAAANAVDFISSTLFIDGRLLATYKDGRARLDAYLDDHAFLLDALLELLQVRWDSTHLDFARRLAELLLAHFYDAQRGGFYFTANDHETLMHRPKPYADDATPSGNGIAAFALQRLGFLLGETRYLEAAERTLQSAAKVMDEYPHGHASLITAFEELEQHPEIVIIRGDGRELARWQRTAGCRYAPHRLVFAIPEGAEELPGALANRAPRAGGPVAYRCVGDRCSLPLASLDALEAELRDVRG